MHSLLITVRQLSKKPGLVLVVVATLALGIGANTAVFRSLDQLLLRPLPVERPGELVVLAVDHPRARTYTFNYPMYRDLAEGLKGLSGLVAAQEMAVSLTLDGQSERARSLVVSENYFQVLGVQAALGRVLDPARDGRAALEPAVVVSHGFWRDRLGGDPNAVGRVLAVNGVQMVVAGVAPSEFRGTLLPLKPDVYVPVHASPRLRAGGTVERGSLDTRFHTWLQLMGRLAPGVTRAQAEAELRGLNAEILKREPDSSPPAVSLEDGRRGHNERLSAARLPMWMLQGAVGLLLLLACFNVANLFLARALSRQREWAIRAAIGATSGRLARQMMTEAAVLGVAGGLAGLGVALGLTPVLVSFHPPGSAGLVSPDLDARALVFAFGVAVSAGLACGVLPAVWAARRAGAGGLGANDFGATPSRVVGRCRKAMVLAQVSLSVLVLAGAGLCLRSVWSLQKLDVGFEPARVLVAALDPGAAGRDDAGARQLGEALLAEMSRSPGVESAALARSLVLSGSGMRISVNRIEGFEPAPGEFVVVDYNVVSPGYFRTLGMPLLSGRDFDARDRTGTPGVVVVNETLAKRYWPGQAAVGKRIVLPVMRPPPVAANSGTILSEDEEELQVIGVVKAGKYRSLTEPETPMMFRAMGQNAERSYVLHVRSASDPSALAGSVRAAVRGLDPNLPVFDVRTLEEQRAGAAFLHRMLAALLTGFGVLALLLAALGVYGVAAYTVSRGAREIGIRMALGAEGHQVVGLFVRRGMSVAGAGVALGLLGALGATQAMRGLLHGVTPSDPLTYGVLTAVVTGVAWLACWIPSRRAARVDPVVVLREE